MKKAYYIWLSILASFINISAFSALGYKWPGKFPVADFYINERGSEDVLDEWEYLQRSFDVWEEVPTAAIMTEYKGLTSVGKASRDQVNVVTWMEGDDWPLGRHVVGACYVWHHGSAITGFDVIFNGRDYQWSTTGEDGKMDVGHVSTHEAGHALGLNHTGVKDAVMWPRASYAETHHQKLHADDSAGITHLYPRTGTNNHPPVIISSPVTEAIAGMKYQYQVTAEDADGDDLVYYLTQKPVNMRIDSLTGQITWFPKFLDLGRNNITVMVKDEMGASAIQTFAVTVSNLVVYTTDKEIGIGDTLYQEVLVSPMDEFGIFAGNIELSYDSGKVSILEVDTLGAAIAGASFVKNITPSMIKVAFAGADPYSGEGVLFRIKMIIYEEHCGELIRMDIQKAFFNDGDPAATIKNGTIFQDCGGGGGYGYNVDGKVLYAGNEDGVSGVSLEMPEIGRTSVTTAEGFFAFKQVPRRSVPFTLSAAKDSGDVRNAVSAYDASLILRYVVGLHELDAYEQQIHAADVNVNGMLTAYDAALILRYMVGYPDESQIGNWVMLPAEQEFPNLLEPLHNIIFYSYLIGDVSGNWNFADGGLPKRSSQSEGDAVMSEFEKLEASPDPDEGTGYKTVVSLSGLSEDIYSGEFEIEFDSERYTLAQVKPLALLNGYLVKSNAVENKILVVFAGTEPLAGLGELFELEIRTMEPSSETVGAPDNNLLSYSKFNEKAFSPVNVVKDRPIFSAGGANAVTSIFPNPFRERLTVEYRLTDTQQMRLTVHDLKGRELVSLFDGHGAPGLHTVTWNGTDADGNYLPAQMYLLRMTAAGHTNTVRLFKVK